MVIDLANMHRYISILLFISNLDINIYMRRSLSNDFYDYTKYNNNRNEYVFARRH